jgi:AcrR family transcriptional regulator
MTVQDPSPRPGLRERKKAQTRKAIADSAKRMFAERSYAKVTVAEIADAANIAVKTLFTYFASKEDILFEGEDDACEALVDHVAGRPRGSSPFEAMQSFMLAHVDATGRGALAELEAFQKMIDGGAPIAARLLSMWEHFEERLTEVLALETGAPADAPVPRAVAAMLIAMYRLQTSREVRSHIAAFPPERQREARRQWIQASAAAIGSGVRDYARRA